jgi:hypothetical protein
MAGSGRVGWVWGQSKVKFSTGKKQSKCPDEASQRWLECEKDERAKEEK